ncbi:hypothetical protein BVC80_1781g26 [Macleaya cordata]|uniref:Uncharacterized protein n=1 Tax=Macleaya cordata TaxID=56857 RepID=A0A200QTW8_MACCD|nr:hypothetical protein BVC80_1781g26 [Macleaya cordata]
MDWLACSRESTLLGGGVKQHSSSSCCCSRTLSSIYTEGSSSSGCCSRKGHTSTCIGEFCSFSDIQWTQLLQSMFQQPTERVGGLFHHPIFLLSLITG